MNPYAKSKEEALSAFERALLNVAPDYFASSLPDGNASFGERVFAYELYHQMRLGFSGEWYVHGEFRKGLRVIPQVNSQSTIIPDLVVHQPDTLEKNLLAVEIKTTPNLTGSNLLQDLQKLDFCTKPTTGYCGRGLGFLIGVMLVTNIDFENFYRRLDARARQNICDVVKRATRVAVWNIPKPVASERGNLGELTRSCLKVFRADWAGWSG